MIKIMKQVYHYQRKYSLFCWRFQQDKQMFHNFLIIGSKKQFNQNILALSKPIIV